MADPTIQDYQDALAAQSAPTVDDYRNALLASGSLSPEQTFNLKSDQITDKLKAGGKLSKDDIGVLADEMTNPTNPLRKKIVTSIQGGLVGEGIIPAVDSIKSLVSSGMRKVTGASGFVGSEVPTPTMTNGGGATLPPAEAPAQASVEAPATKESHGVISGLLEHAGMPTSPRAVKTIISGYIGHKVAEDAGAPGWMGAALGVLGANAAMKGYQAIQSPIGNAAARAAVAGVKEN